MWHEKGKVATEKMALTLRGNLRQEKAKGSNSDLRSAGHTVREVVRAGELGAEQRS